jgi:hypothetical protein
MNNKQVTKIKGTLSRDFLLLVFFINQFPPSPRDYPIWTVSNFFENLRRYSQIKVDHRCRWHQWQKKKIFNQKIFNNFVGTPLDSRGYTYIHFCLQVHFRVSAAWYYSHCLPPVSTTPVTNLPPVSLIPVAICHPPPRVWAHIRQRYWSARRHLFVTPWPGDSGAHISSPVVDQTSA